MRKVLRSTYPHAKLVWVDASRAGSCGSVGERDGA
jgi:hypothetical protein